jgi:hypothetical protein
MRIGLSGADDDAPLLRQLAEDSVSAGDPAIAPP